MSTVSEPQTAAPSPEPGRRGRGRRVLVALALVALATAGVVIAFVIRTGEARSPKELGDRFREADVTCRSWDVINNDRGVKTLGCRTDDAKIITVTTYGNRPSAEEWLGDWCATTADGKSRNLRRGYYVIGEDFILDIHQLARPGSGPTPVNRTARELARVLDGTAAAYRCRDA